MVYALSAGGAALVAAYAASRTLAGMGVALVLTGLTDRLRRDRLLRWITGLRMVLLAAAALFAGCHQPSAAVIAAGAASSSLAGTYRPLQAAVLPWLVRTPAELAASNAVTAVMENSGAVLGPLVAGGLLVVAGPAAAMAAAGCLAVATMSLLRLTVPGTPKLAARGVVQVVRDVTSGLAEFLRMAPPGGVAVLAFAQTVLRGALVVLIAVLAVRVLGLGGSAVGWLNAAFGAGGLAGGALATARPGHPLQRGDCFGEIALLRGTPRTATITAGQPLRTLTLGRDEFLTAVTGNSTSKTAADELAARRLSTDPPDHGDRPAPP